MVEETVRAISPLPGPIETGHSQMEKYWKARPRAPKPTATPSAATSSGNAVAGLMQSEYDRHHQTLLTHEEDEGWQAELRRYLKDVPADVTKDTDIVKWWQVCILCFSMRRFTHSMN